MKRLDWSSLSVAERRTALARPARRRDPQVSDVVGRIFEEVAGEGEAGPRGGPEGDLYIFVEVKPHDLFDRDQVHALIATDGSDVSVDAARKAVALLRPTQVTETSLGEALGRTLAEPVRSAVDLPGFTNSGRSS